jgi:hypothetical protein
MLKSNWNRYPGGKQIATGCGDRIREWFYARCNHTFGFGVTFRAVTFADHRSGWSGVNMHVDLGWWGFARTILAWKSGSRKEYVVITLAEQIRRSHSMGPSLEEQEEREEAEKAEELARLALFDKQLKEYNARHPKPEGE